MKSDLIRHKHKRRFRKRMGKLIYKDQMNLLLPRIPTNAVFYTYLKALNDRTIKIIDENMNSKQYVWTGKAWKYAESLVPSDYPDANYSRFLSHIPKINFKIGS